ncbi:MAG: hypothetical protein OHK006_06210 [Thermodesulfovibrionales bacterium]
MLIGDNDFWWHLRTGAYISEHAGLLESDPFSLNPYTESRSGREDLVLNGYWLSQVILYWTFQAFGFSGVHILKAVMYTAVFLAQWRILNTHGVPGALRYPVIGFAVCIMLFYFPGERPQIFTFLFSVLIVGMLERHRKDKAGSLPLLPVIMAAWANMHPGFFIGAVIIGVYLVSDGVERLSKAERPLREGRRSLWVWGPLSLAASLLNPNTYHVVPILLDLNKTSALRDITEYQGIIALSRNGWTTPVVLEVSVAALAAAAFVAGRRKMDPVHAVLLAGTVAGGLYAYRLFALTLVVGIPLIGVYLGMGLDRLGKRDPIRKVKRHVSAAVYLAVIAGSAAIMAFLISEGMVFRNTYNRPGFPVGAADFLENNKVRGNIFNHYNSGGYLIWRLYPACRVFIDGRAISDEAYETYIAVLGGEQAGAPAGFRWSEILDAFGLNIILINPVDEMSGEIYPLLESLIGSASWKLVYFDDRDVIFVRAGAVQGELVRIYNIPKEFSYNTVIALSEKGIAEAPENPNFYVSMARALRGLGRGEEAEVFFSKVRRMLPAVPGGGNARDPEG